MTRRRSTVVAARRHVHTLAVLLGDARAVQTGRVPQRIANRIGGRLLARGLRRVWL